MKVHIFFSLGLKNKRFVCPFGPKIKRVGRSIFFLFFFLIWVRKKCKTIHVMCVQSWACRTSELKLILVLKGDCIPLFLVKEPFWDSCKNVLTFYLNIFVTKCIFECQKNKKTKNKKQKQKKNPTLFFQYFGSVGKGQTNILFLGLINPKLQL